MQDTSTQPSHIQGNPDNGENANRCKSRKQEESLLKN